MHFERDELAVIFEESMHMIADNAELSRLAKESTKNTEVINDAKKCTADNYRRKSEGNNVSVIVGTSFDTARELMEKYDGKKKVAVLNFANAYKPGGGVVKGARAQEECLCRCSTLYKSLKKVSETSGFYGRHKLHRMLFPDELNQPGIIYTPEVAIFRTDDYKVLDKPVIVDVITCAAPDLRRRECDEAAMRNIHEEKATAILNIAISHDVDIIILGAFGCGAFGNPPEIVADVYKKILNQQVRDVNEEVSRDNVSGTLGDDELIYRNCFDEIVFAIRSKNELESVNYSVFSRALCSGE